MRKMIKISDEVRDSYVHLLKAFGEDGLFKRSIGLALKQSANIKNPDIGMLDLSEEFFTLYRRTGDDAYAAISRALKRSAHVVHRELLRQNSKKKPSNRFLTLCA